MKIAVVNSYVPFQSSETDQLAHTLTAKLIEYGHDALFIRIPFCEGSPSNIIDSMLACRMMCLPNVDRVIALNFPAYYIPHPEKIVWIQPLCGAGPCPAGSSARLITQPAESLPDSPLGREMQASIDAADNRYLAEALRIFTTSMGVSERLNTYQGLDSQLLWPPIFETGRFTCNSYDDFVFYPGLVNDANRQWLAVESMHHVSSPVRLILAGKAENETDARRLYEIISANGLDGRVSWQRESISEPSKIDHFSRALATLYLPSNEGSHGRIALESYYSNKPVVTCTDSRETSLLVKDSVTGFVVSPDPQEIGRAIDRLYQDKPAARAMGRAGLDLIRDLGITWTHVVEALTE